MPTPHKCQDFGMPALLLAQASHAGRGSSQLRAAVMAGASRSLTCCEPALLNHEGAPRSLHNSSRVHLRLALQDSKGAVTMWSMTSAPRHYILLTVPRSSPCAPPRRQHSGRARQVWQARVGTARQAACPAAVAPHAREWPHQSHSAVLHPGQGCLAWPLGQVCHRPSVTRKGLRYGSPGAGAAAGAGAGGGWVGCGGARGLGRSR